MNAESIEFYEYKKKNPKRNLCKQKLTTLVSLFVPVSTFRLFNSKLNFMLAKVERSPSLSITC